jgi:hypothetical protein
MDYVELQAIEKATASVQAKYPDYHFEVLVEETVSGSRAIVDVRMWPLSEPNNTTNLQLIVRRAAPMMSAEVESAMNDHYRTMIEGFFRHRIENEPR